MRRLITASLLLAGFVAGAQAQTFPSRSITLIVPFPPGGSTDVTARIMAEKMRPILGQPVIIENVGGAGGSIAVGRLARAPADGYTIDIGQWDTHVGSIIYNINYDLQTDFEPVGLISVNPQLLVAKKSLAANDLKSLVAWMKANPGEAKFVNQNAAAQVTGILMEKATGTKVTYIPYRGAGPAMTDLVSGQVDLLVIQGAAALPQIRGGTIGVGRVARAAPDGYTIDIGQWDTHVGSIIYPLNYDLQKDFEPIGLMSNNPQLMIARKGFPADDLKGLVAYMKANPGKATFVDQNAAAKVTGILMMQATGTQVLFIPYRGAGPAMQDMLAQQVDLMVVQAAVTLPQARAGAVKIVANLSPARSSVIPTIPTSAESGIPGLYASGWFGIFAPKGTPKEIIAKLNGAMVQALADPAIKARFSDLGLDVATREQQTPEGLAAFHKGEIEKWWPIIKAAGIKVE